MAALATIAPGGAPQRRPDGGEPVVAHGEFLAEAGGQQERVVGGRADHEDGEDALHLPVDPDDAVVGERVDDGAGQAEGEHRAEDDHRRQQHAAVHEQQDDQDGGEGDAEQQSVDAREGVGQVRLARGRSRTAYRGAAGRGRLRSGPVEGVGRGCRRGRGAAGRRPPWPGRRRTGERGTPWPTRRAWARGRARGWRRPPALDPARPAPSRRGRRPRSTRRSPGGSRPAGRPVAR